MIAIYIPGEAVPFARAGAQGKRRFTPKRQTDFMTTVKVIAGQAMAGREPMAGPIELKARFVYLVPPSWSKRRQQEAKWKASKPDADNLIKIVKDALNTITWIDDAQVADMQVQKVYGPVAGITVTVQEAA